MNSKKEMIRDIEELVTLNLAKAEVPGIVLSDSVNRKPKYIKVKNNTIKKKRTYNKIFKRK